MSAERGRATPGRPVLAPGGVDARTGGDPRATPIGVEDTQLFDVAAVGAPAVLDWAAEHGLDGVAFKSIAALSPVLDPGELAEVRAHADALGLYVEVGIGSVNPLNVPETPFVRDLGDGDTLRGFRRLIEAAAAIGCVDLLGTTAHWKGRYGGRLSFDRFRTDVAWEDQLLLTERLLARLAPVLRDQGCRIAIETHEEISSFEVVRLVEAVGPDALGIAFDVGNVICRGETPQAAAERVAPYVRSTHVKDAILVRRAAGATAPDPTAGTPSVPRAHLAAAPHPAAEGDLVRWLRPCGEGVIDWPRLLRTVLDGRPHVRLTLEDNQNPKLIELGDPAWRAAHPDLTDREVTDLEALAERTEERIASGAWPAGPTGDEPRWDLGERARRLLRSRDALRVALAEAELEGTRR